MDVLEKIFGSSAKVKIMRMFLFNPGASYDISLIVERAKLTEALARKELKTLQDIGLIKKKSFVKDVEVKIRKKRIVKRKKVAGWVLDDTFSYLASLQSFLIHVSPLQDKEVIKRFSRVGKIRLLIISGIFMQERESRVDLLIVGDNLKKGLLETTVKNIESEAGKELSYASFETSDFQYRLGMYDKLIRDILDYPHKKLINKIGI